MAGGAQLRCGRDKVMCSSLSPTRVTGARINIPIKVIRSRKSSGRKTANGGIRTTNGTGCDLRENQTAQSDVICPLAFALHREEGL